MIIDDIISEIRFHVVDQKTQISNIVDETPATGKESPFLTINTWNATATGRDGEEFLTKNMPLISGCSLSFRGGRWNYDYAGQFSHPYDSSTYSGKKQFLIDFYRAMFVVPSGATPVPSGDKVLLTYSWTESNEYRFSDDEIKVMITAGDSYLRERLTLPYQIYGRDTDLSLVPVPSGVWFSLLALASSYFLRSRLQEERIQDGIIIRQGQTAFNTTATLPHGGRSLEMVKNDLNSIIKSVKMGELAEAGYKIDIYSTYQSDPTTGIGSSQDNYITGAKPWV